MSRRRRIAPTAYFRFRNNRFFFQPEEKKIMKRQMKLYFSFLFHSSTIVHRSGSREITGSAPLDSNPTLIFYTTRIPVWVLFQHVVKHFLANTFKRQKNLPINLRHSSTIPYRMLPDGALKTCDFSTPTWQQLCMQSEEFSLPRIIS